ncbi:MAG TPA: TetR/AcrR family transcriptional regulator [Streptosporangiaceae bacterium]|jgi:AcrR family transcriptional regulator|nr:TetR/AcrR family transcriptional regulator [Streptosporangiaceae bacterium]
MAQVLKQAVRARIQDAALRCFANHGYGGTSMAEIAAAAQTAPANLYRYYASKEALFDAVVPADLVARHDTLLDTRVAALAQGTANHSTAAAELLNFWLDHRLAMVVLLDRAEGTPFASYPAAFVRRLVKHAEQALDSTPSPAHDSILHLVFDNTRRAIAQILATGRDREHTSALIAGFWSYQLPGLNGLMTFINADLALATRTQQISH